MTRKPKHIARRWTKFLLIIIGAIAAVVLGYLYWYTHRPLPEDIENQRLFAGITYTRSIQSDPHPMIVHVVKIDLDTAGLEFLVTPDGGAEGFVYRARTASQFLEEFDLQLVINADFFHPWKDYGPLNYYPHVGDGVDTRGLAASRGVLSTEGFLTGRYLRYAVPLAG